MAAVLAAIIAVVALVVVLARQGGSTPATPADEGPHLGGGPAPTDVRLRDFGSSVQVRWTDPNDGKTTFLITGGRPDEVLRPMGEVPPGRTSFDLNGLSSTLDYCFAVVAVYGTDEFASSPQVCTDRTASPAPSGD